MNNNYNIIRIQQYLSGALSREEMHQLEREALADPLLNDAIEGYRLRNEVDHGQLSLLQQRLAARIEGQQKERHAFYFGWQRLSIAATACVLMVLLLVLLWMRSHINQPEAAHKEVAVELAGPEWVAGLRALPMEGDGLNAQPVDGWMQFNAYLAEQHKEAALRGEVTLVFDIDAQGKPTTIEGIGTANPDLVAEAERLLKAGPVWMGDRGKVVFSFE